MQLPDNFVDNLIALKSSPAFPGFLVYLRELCNECKDQLVDPVKAADMGQVIALRSAYMAYQNLIVMFESDLSMIKEQLERDRENGAATGDNPNK